MKDDDDNVTNLFKEKKVPEPNEEMRDALSLITGDRVTYQSLLLQQWFLSGMMDVGADSALKILLAYSGRMIYNTSKGKEDYQETLSKAIAILSMSGGD